MAIYEIVFSPTGGTKKVSGMFTKAFGGESVCLDLMDREENFKKIFFGAEDVCIVAVPSYGGRVPAIAVDRLKQMTGGGAKAILITVYGNRAYEDTLLELQDTLTGVGFICVAAVAAIAEHSIMHQFAAGRPNADDEKELAGFAAEVFDRMQNGTLPDQLLLPGNRPYREYGGVPMKPKAGKECIKCGICARKCPVGAIPVEDPSKTDNETCISCMGCVAVCPNKARSVNKMLLTAGAMKMKAACSDYKKNALTI